MGRITPIPFLSIILAVWTVAIAVAAGVGTAAASAAPSGSAITEVQQVPKYERSKFGDGWSDLDRDCQDSRNEILIRDLVDERLDRDGCKVLTGTLHDPYTGATIAFTRGRTTSDDVQIDHVTPLAYAWRAGAWRWTDQQREAFANDPRNLLAVDGPTNNSKGADGPSQWLPPNPAAHCFYAQRWTEVLHAYDLTPLPADAAELNEITKECE